ncbi:MAG: hypothetical protein HOK06_08010 [Rhodospirillaceae bacterium]|jgi:hypothetical protein|nr:hypothetical protein [Rhodospirillaceae bacterium]MBT4219166.1 hypothetical protein [Rhodospirillaceae bacterium]MBT4464046.1 hypothetical protein [Rhodospirillaceae bacterium]MBT5014020.1 hypothetical protein [Rhodospirillaceae bacterium]MBT5309818.1 hypothetical protein [Rhodospirillaceae bacterium]
MQPILKLLSTIGRTYNVDLDDTFRTKTALNKIGYYKPPKFGITQYPDEPMFDALEKFQADNGLRRDGVMKPGGPTASRIAAQLAQMTRQKPTTAHRSKPRLSFPRSFGLNAALGDGQDNRESDVKAAKRALSWAGHYPAAKAQKPDGRADSSLLSGLLDFQKSAGLKVDGWMRPGGETATTLDRLITPEIAKMKKRPFGDGPEPDEPDEPKPDPDEPPKKPDEPKPNEDKCQDISEELEKVWDQHDALHDENVKLYDKIAERLREIEVIRSKRPEEFFSENDMDRFRNAPDPLGQYLNKKIEQLTYGYSKVKIRRGLGEVTKREKIRALKKENATDRDKIKKNEAEMGKLYDVAGELERRLEACQKNKQKR